MSGLKVLGLVTGMRVAVFVLGMRVEVLDVRGFRARGQGYDLGREGPHQIRQLLRLERRHPSRLHVFLNRDQKRPDGVVGFGQGPHQVGHLLRLERVDPPAQHVVFHLPAAVFSI